MNYIPVIGLEIHCELLTKSKVFCSCKNQFGGEENSRACPRCIGLPGTLPSINKNAVTLAAKAGFCLDCTVNNYSSFDRKNYFYPDLPKAYQITQFEHPICTDGYVIVCDDKKIRIKEIHIEEDAGKLIHDDLSSTSSADYNRCGVPLIEIVTEPDFGSTDEVTEFVKEVSLRLKYADVCDAKMEQGSLRVDVNISLMAHDSKVLGTRAEIKNLNSLRAIERAINYEIERQSQILERNEIVNKETRRFDEKTGKTSSLRSKETLSDYRYFPEPDILPIFINDEELKIIKNSVPEMPHTRYARYTKNFGLSHDDAKLLVSSKEFSSFYDEAVKITPNYKLIANLMLIEINRNLNEKEISFDDINFTPNDIASLSKMISQGLVSNNSAKEIVKIMLDEGASPYEIAKKYGLLMDNDTERIKEAIKSVISENIKLVNDYKSGNTKIFGFIMGQTMHKIGKGANPKLVNEILLSMLN